VTVRAIVGLTGLNFVVLVVGVSVLSAIRPWRSWVDTLRLAGVGYLVGVSSLFTVLAAELVLGVPIRPSTFALTSACLAGAGVWSARRRANRGLERSGGLPPGLPSIGVAVFVGAAAVYYLALFRAARLSDLSWDVWASWLPKAKAIYFTGGLDPALLASLPGPSYPPGLPALHAVAFHAMGSADATTLHLQYWFLGVGFAGAVIGLLTTLVRPVLLCPLMLLLLLMPDIRNRATDLYGDVPLGYLVALGALLVLLWIRERDSWQLVTATILLGGAMLTKREGILFALCIVVAALVATYRERRQTWPRIVAMGAAAFALALPWRVWFMLESLPSDAPEEGYLGVFDHLDRAWASHELVLRTLFDYDLWLLVPTLAIAAIGLAFVAGARREAVFAAAFLVTAAVGSAWTFWSNPSLDIGVEEGLVNRVVGTPALALGAMIPLLLELAWRGRAGIAIAEDVGRARARTGPVAVAMGVVVALIVAYPAITVAKGGPRFPSPEDCVLAPVSGQKVRVVFGYRATLPEAIALRDRALEVGFEGTEAAQDGCGRARVSVDGVPSIAVGQEVVAAARTVELDPALELDPDG